MGCSSSSTAVEDTPHVNTPVKRGTRKLVGLPEETFELEDTVPKASETVSEAYHRLDEEICKIESTCAGPRLLTAEAWIDHLATTFKQTHISSTMLQRENKFAMDVTVVEIPNGIPVLSSPSESGVEVSDRSRDDTAKLALKLDVALDPVKAARHEEFIARISRAAMALEAGSFQTDMVDISRRRAQNLRRTFAQLKALYAELDYLIASANNGSYSSLNEQRLDGELESAREIRDRLGGVCEQWRTAASMIRASANGMLQSVEFWNLVGSSKDAAEKISLALDSRTACHGALIAMEAAQDALPQVEIPFVTVRQQSALKHGLIYMLTDMANPARYRHTKHVLEGFLKNVEMSVRWVHDTYSDTLKKDLLEADQSVLSIAKQLREIRTNYLRQRLGSKVYVRPALRQVEF
ncbi:uncharacterized protein LOC131681742 isoform X2 [Topomyia yanbarensis]|uniref:uncharacterized protein LOC131681742 isoform X2 n=1 Tax=Topomyia yanbarensis TaxID=2498891 RepID=UPI00273AB8A2|nr:uncharacterized protein LOC131681742 isoform X2 [Topomyia yanbarensis]